MEVTDDVPRLLQNLSIVSTGAQVALLATLGLALVLSSLIGLEREMRLKSAGLRTHTLVGVGSCLIMLVSKYGFSDVISAYEITLDPSRIASQIVSGIGFIGGGLIFVQRDVVRGLTTAATIWLVAGVGMACGAGLPILAAFVTATHFLVVYAYTPLARGLLAQHLDLQIDFHRHRGTLQGVLDLCAGRGFVIESVAVDSSAATAPGTTQRLNLKVRGRHGVAELLVMLQDMDGVESVRIERRE